MGFGLLVAPPEKKKNTSTWEKGVPSPQDRGEVGEWLTYEGAKTPISREGDLLLASLPGMEEFRHIFEDFASSADADPQHFRDWCARRHVQTFMFLFSCFFFFFFFHFSFFSSLVFGPLGFHHFPDQLSKLSISLGFPVRKTDLKSLVELPSLSPSLADVRDELAGDYAYLQQL